jgi:GntR family transcriptional regulator
MNLTAKVIQDDPTNEPALALNAESFVPYYAQIEQQVRNLIIGKKLSPGEPFYSEGELARTLGVSKMPVRQAFQKLRSEGLLVIKRGKKPVIGSGPVPWNFRELHGFSEEMRALGLVPSARVLAKGLQSADPEIAKALRIGLAERVYGIKRLRFINNEPVALVTSYLPAQLFPGLDNQDLEGQSLYYIFEHIYQRNLLRAEEVIGAITAGREEAQILRIATGSGLLHIKETSFDTQQIPLEFSESLLRGDRYTVSVASERRG